MPMLDPTRPEGVQLESVSSKLVNARMVVTSIALGLPALMGIVLVLTVSPWFWFLAGSALLVFAWLLWLIPRQVRNIGYATEDSDFVVRRGALFRRLNVIPYGRIQFVDVSEGPLLRAFGLATLQLHTASAGTDATVPGLAVEQANALRERLVERGAGQLSGL